MKNFYQDGSLKTERSEIMSHYYIKYFVKNNDKISCFCENKVFTVGAPETVEMPTTTTGISGEILSQGCKNSLCFEKEKGFVVNIIGTHNFYFCSPKQAIYHVYAPKVFPDLEHTRIAPVITLIREFTKEEYLKHYLALVDSEGLILYSIPESIQTEEMCIKAVAHTGRALAYVKEQTERICETAVAQDGRALYYVKKDFKTPKMCMIAVKNNGLALYYVDKTMRSDEICLEAVKQNGFALLDVIDLTEEICKEAVKRTPGVSRYLR